MWRKALHAEPPPEPGFHSSSKLIILQCYMIQPEVRGMPAAWERVLLEEIRELRASLERIEALLEERLLGVDEPLPDEAEAVEEYERSKKSGNIELLRLDDLIGDEVMPMSKLRRVEEKRLMPKRLERRKGGRWWRGLGRPWRREGRFYWH